MGLKRGRGSIAQLVTTGLAAVLILGTLVWPGGRPDGSDAGPGPRETCVKSGEAEGEPTTADNLNLAMAKLHSEGMKAAEIKEQIAEQWCVQAIGSSADAPANAMKPVSGTEDAYFQDVFLFFDGAETRSYFAMADFSWRNDDFADDMWLWGFCGTEEVGHPDGIAIAINQLEPGTTSFAKLDSSVLVWGNPGMNGYKDDFGYTKYTTPTTYNINGSGFEIQDQARRLRDNVGWCMDDVFDFNMYQASIVYQFYQSTGACQDVQVSAQYVHTWDNTVITGFDIGRENLAINWQTNSEGWQMAGSASYGHDEVCTSAGPPGDWRASGAGSNTGGGGQNNEHPKTAGDYNNNGLSDLALYRQDCTNGSSWWVANPSTNQQLVGGTKYGGCTDIPVPGDYDGDGSTDLALFRQDCTNGSSWWVKSSRTGRQIYGGLKYGGCTDIPAPGDYDGDGYADLALYRKDCTNGSSWWVRSTRTETQIYGGLKYGGCTDVPAPGDYDNDGHTDLALYRKDCTNGSSWWVRSSRTTAQIYGGLKYGGCGDIPAPGDYDGDGYADLALYRKDCTNGSSWWVRSTRTETQIYGNLKYGGCTDIPAPGDFDGDGYTDMVLYRRDCTNGSSWWVRSSRTGSQLYGGLKYGGCGDIPAVA